MKTKVFFDLDWCLIDGDYAYTLKLSKLKALVEQAKSIGLELSINSNRSLKDIMPFYNELGFNGIIIGENGAFSYDPATDKEKVFTSGSASEILKALGTSLNGVALKVINTSEFTRDPEQFSFSDGAYVLAEESRHYTGSLYCRRIASGKPALNEELRSTLKSTLNSSGLLTRYNVSDSSNCVLTVTAKDCDKTKPLSRNLDDWICAIGDGVTDIPVLKFADFSAAPANAKPEVKAIVNYVSSESITAGVYDIIGKIIRGVETSETTLIKILEKQMQFTEIVPLKAAISGVVGAGTRKCFLLKGRLPNGDVLAIKAGKVGSTSGDEVRKNYEAYEHSKSLGVDIIPQPYEFVSQDGINILVMEYGDRNFITDVRNNWVEDLCERNAGFLFLNVADRLKEVYKKTLRVNAEASKNFVRKKIADQVRYFESYLIPTGLVDKDAAERVKALDIDKLAPKKVTWTTGGELTPEQVCISKRGLFIVDPRNKDELLGLPQVDLGMFAVLSRDIYKLPCGRVGYSMMRQVSDEVSELQGANADILWEFAQMRQYSLSSRFRIGKEDERAAEYASIAQQKLEALETLL